MAWRILYEFTLVIAIEDACRFITSESCLGREREDRAAVFVASRVRTKEKRQPTMRSRRSARRVVMFGRRRRATTSHGGPFESFEVQVVGARGT